MNITFHPNTKQHKAFQYLTDNETKEILYGGAAGGGKSFLGCAWLIIMCLQYPETRWLMGRSKLKTLKDTTLNTFFDVCKMWGLENGEDFKYNSQSNIITFTNGSQILLKDLFYYPSDPNFDSLGSLEITGAFIDEVNQCTKMAIDTTKSRIRYKLDQYNLIPKVFMSCNPAKNWVYKEFYKPFKEGNLIHYKKFIQALVTDNKEISEHYIQNLKTLSQRQQQRLLYGNWDYDDDPSYMFQFDDIQSLFTNTHVELGDKYITADIGRLGADATVIIYWEGMRAEDIVIIPRAELDKQKDSIESLKNSYGVKNSNIIIDEDGVGGGLKDFMKGIKGFVNNSSPINKENYTNLKSQCYFYLAKAVNKGEVFISEKVANKLYKGKAVHEYIIEELGVIKEKDIDKDSKLSVIPKKEIKLLLGRSPDFADALMMRMFFNLNKKYDVSRIHFL